MFLQDGLSGGYGAGAMQEFLGDFESHPLCLGLGAEGEQVNQKQLYDTCFKVEYVCHEAEEGYWGNGASGEDSGGKGWMKTKCEGKTIVNSITLYDN